MVEQQDALGLGGPTLASIARSVGVDEARAAAWVVTEVIPLTALLVQGEKPKDEKPAPPAWGDYVRFGGGLVFTPDVGTKELVLANVYWQNPRKQTEEEKDKTKLFNAAKKTGRAQGRW